MYTDLFEKYNNDPYQVFLEIYKNYHKYGFISYEDCKNSLMLEFNEILNIDLDEIKIIDLLRKEEHSINRDSQIEFDKQLKELYGKCVVSGIDSYDCQACHIIPVSENGQNNINNGLLLNSGLHKSFDDFKWSINQNGFIESKEYEGLNIKQYVNKQVNINVNNKILMDNLKWHYDKYLNC